MTIQDGSEYGLFRALCGGLRVLPRAWARSGLFHLGQIAVRRRWWRSDVAHKQMARVFPEWSESQVTRQVEKLFHHLADTIMEIFVEDPSEVASRILEPVDWSPFEKALAGGKGVILASLHLGNFELCGRVIAGRCSLLDVVKVQRNPLFDRYLDGMRKRHGILTVPVDGAGRATLSHLRQGHVVSLLLDQDAGDKGVIVDFMGLRASTWPGAARLSLQTGCPVLPVSLVRMPDGKHQLKFGATLEPDSLPADQRDITAYTQRISRELEVFVRSHPEQWFWVHRRWKSGGMKKAAGP